MELKKLYTVKDHKVIPGLGINGPITTPTEMEITDVLKMVTNKYEVYQHNPYNKSEKVRVTVSNLRSIEFSLREGIKATADVIKKNKEKKDYTVEVVHKPTQQDNGGNGKKDKHNKKDRYENNNQKVDEREERVNKPDKFES